MNETKLTPDTQRKIVDLVRAGKFVSTAAILAGVHRDTVYEWLRRGGLEPESIYGHFADEYREAEAEFESTAIDSIVGDEKGHKGLQWFMEKRFPERYGKSVKAELSGPNGGPVQVTHVDPVALATRIRALATGGATAALPGRASAGASGDDGPREDGTTDDRGGTGG